MPLALKILRSFAAACALLGLMLSAPSAAAEETAKEYAVLFIGNSLTQNNNLPKIVAELAKAGKQRPLHVEQETKGGYSLERHWNENRALEKIRSRKWDVVVVQEYSANPWTKKASMFEYGKKFDAEIKKQGAKTLLYMTWAYQDKPELQATIRKAYRDLAAETGAEVAPVGDAWEAALAADPKLSLHVKDKKHPTPAGSYLAGCVFYAALFQKSPEGLPPQVKLTDEEVRPLQSIAWRTVKAKAE